MTDSHISSIITGLNSNKLVNRIFTRQISSNVEFAFYWRKKPNINDEIVGNECPYKLYLIKNEKKYIGAVLDMYNDLHWYLQVKYRKNGFLTKALKTAILPHIFIERDKQVITIDRNSIGRINYSNSKKSC